MHYLIAGGLAVNAHGYMLFTKDVDFVIQLIPENIIMTFEALKTSGYRPLVPITAWIRDKGMKVLRLWSDDHMETPIDVFVSEPFPFDEEFGKALVKPLPGIPEVRFVSIPTLIAMKRLANRPQDQIDIEHLQMKLMHDQ